ncbi:MAG: right-handed parallel beta-helix repeat-containing protein [Acidimicrobiales bacterium]
MPEVAPPFEACEVANGDFVFVSYSHENKDIVYKFLQDLRNLGAKIWFDGGIPDGSDWKPVLVDALTRCAGFIVILTPESVVSDNVVKEVGLADRYKKLTLCLFLENVDLRGALEYDLLGKQHLYRFDLDDNTFERKVRKFLALSGIEPRVESEAVQPEVEQPVSEHPDIEQARSEQPEVEQQREAEQPKSAPANDFRPASGSQTVPVVEAKPKRVVDATGAGSHYRSISAAIAEASPGDTIMIREGRYEEELQIAMPLTLVGMGPPGAVVVTSDDSDVVNWSAGSGQLNNLAIEQTGTGGRWSGIVVHAGNTVIRGCSVSSGSGSSCVVSDTGRAVLHQSRLYSSNVGISVVRGGSTEIEDCFIESHGLYGVEVRGAHVTLRHSSVDQNGASGIFVGDGGTATVERNQISRNDEDGVQITSGAEVTVQGNFISKNKGAAIKLTFLGQGTVKGNCLDANRGGRVVALKGSQLKASDNSVQVGDLPDAGPRIPKVTPDTSK